MSEASMRTCGFCGVVWDRDVDYACPACNSDDENDEEVAA